MTTTAHTPRALTVRQPWADAITHGTKRTENRTRRTHYRGQLLIHAGAAHDPMGRFVITDWDLLDSWPDTRGAIIAVATLTDCHAATDGCCAPWGFPDTWHWVLEDVRPLATPVPCKGRLGLWTPDDELLAAVDAPPVAASSGSPVGAREDGGAR